MASDIESRVMSLTRRYGFRPTRVIVRGTHATILFENQKGEASRYVSQLKPAMKQMGVPENAMKSREVSHPAEAGLPAEHVGVVEIDFSRMLERASRPGAKDTMAVEDRFYFGKGRKERFANSPFEQISGQERLSDALTKMGSANAMLDVLAYFARQYGKERIVKAVRNTYSSARAQEILSKLFATI